MARATVTPWRSQKDLLQVRQQLYRLEESPTPANGQRQTQSRHQTDNADHRRHAIRRIQAWKARGNLPHAVESSALLLDAILHHDAAAAAAADGLISPFSVRAGYAAALTRLVTGFCDIGRGKERGLEPSSMLAIARQIALPDAWVALRHEATHQELPETARLAHAAEAAMEWLWAVYWSRLDEHDHPEDGDDDLGRRGGVAGGEGGEGLPSTTAASLGARREAVVWKDFQAEARQLLRGFRSARREALRARRGGNEGHDADLAARKVVKACSELTGNDAAKLDLLGQVFVQDKLLLPSNRVIGSPLDGAFLIWDGILQELFRERPRFLRGLVNALLSSAASASTMTEGDAEAHCCWLLHIVDRDAWPAATPSEKHVIRRHMMMWCCAHPGQWSKYLGNAILTNSSGSCDDEESEELEQDWGALFRISQFGGEDPGSQFEVQQAEAGELQDRDNCVDLCVAEASRASEVDDVAAMAASAAKRHAPEESLGGWTRQAMQPRVSIGICR